MSYSKLLRWYPKAWREENGDVFLGMLEDDAAARGATKPEFTEAWSIRVHGLAERASYKIALALALVALVGFASPGLIHLANNLNDRFTPESRGSAELLVYALGPALGIWMCTLAGLILLVAARRLGPAPASAAAALFSITALCAGIERLSWSFVPFITGSAALPSPLSHSYEVGATTTFLGLAITTPFAAQRIRPMAVRWVAGLLGAALLALYAYSWLVVKDGFGLAISLSIAAIAFGMHRWSKRSDRPVPLSSPESAKHRGIFTRPRLARLAITASASAAAGFLGYFLMSRAQIGEPLVGPEAWFLLTTLISCCAPIPTILTLSATLRGWLGTAIVWAGALWTVALLLLALAHLPVVVSSGIALGMLTAGSLLATVATALPFGRALPVPMPWGSVAAVTTGLFCWPVLGSDFTAVPRSAPIVCAALALTACWLLIQHRRADTVSPHRALTA